MCHCEICGCNMDEENLDNLSPYSGFPVCENCIDNKEQMERIKRSYECIEKYGSYGKSIEKS